MFSEYQQPFKPLNHLPIARCRWVTRQALVQWISGWSCQRKWNSELNLHTAHFSNHRVRVIFLISSHAAPPPPQFLYFRCGFRLQANRALRWTGDDATPRTLCVPRSPGSCLPRRHANVRESLPLASLWNRWPTSLFSAASVNNK